MAPDAWVRWVTQQPNVEARDIVTSEFQWISRESDVLVWAYSPEHGDFLALNELQLRYSPRMPRRMRAYAALAEERYDLPVFPVLINILPTPSIAIADRYDSEFMGLRARQDYRVLNLWATDADLVFREPLPPLLPFVPILKGGGNESRLRQAVQVLRSDEQLRGLEPLLAFFASFVLETPLVQQIMRWDMTILRESPWYQEILEEGLEQGLQQGARRQLLHVLEHRFGSISSDVQLRLQTLDVQQLEGLVEYALEADSIDEFMTHVSSAGGNGQEPVSAAQ